MAKNKKDITVDDMFPKDHIVGTDIGEGKSFAMVIADYEEKKVFNPRKNQTKIVWTLRFKGAKKPLILNKTNAEAVAEITGSRTAADWVGKTVELYSEWVSAFGKQHLVVRLRKPTGKAPTGEIITDESTGMGPDEQAYYDYGLGELGMDEDELKVLVADLNGDYKEALRLITPDEKGE